MTRYERQRGGLLDVRQQVGETLTLDLPHLDGEVVDPSKPTFCFLADLAPG